MLFILTPRDHAERIPNSRSCFMFHNEDRMNETLVEDPTLHLSCHLGLKSGQRSMSTTPPFSTSFLSRCLPTFAEMSSSFIFTSMNKDANSIKQIEHNRTRQRVYSGLDAGATSGSYQVREHTTSHGQHPLSTQT